MGHPRTCPPKCAKVWCKNAAYDMDIKSGFGVQGHQEMGVAGWHL